MICAWCEEQPAVVGRYCKRCAVEVENVSRTSPLAVPDAARAVIAAGSKPIYRPQSQRPWIALDLYRAGLSLGDIAREIGTHKRTVSRWLQAFGVDLSAAWKRGMDAAAGIG